VADVCRVTEVTQPTYQAIWFMEGRRASEMINMTAAGGGCGRLWGVAETHKKADP
jgi:hypothetical protein